MSRIYASEDLPDCTVLLSPSGDVTVFDIDLVTQKGEWKSHINSPLLASYLFPKASATFLHMHPVAPLATLVLLFSSAGLIQVCVLSIYGDEVTAAPGEPVAIDGVSDKSLTQNMLDITFRLLLKHPVVLRVISVVFVSFTPH